MAIAARFTATIQVHNMIKAKESPWMYLGYSCISPLGGMAAPGSANEAASIDPCNRACDCPDNLTLPSDGTCAHRVAKTTREYLCQSASQSQERMY